MNRIAHNTEYAHVIADALKRSATADFWPYRWTYVSKDKKVTVEFTTNRKEAKYTYTKVNTFLGFKLSETTFSLSSNDVAAPEWHMLGDVLHNTNVRFGQN